MTNWARQYSKLPRLPLVFFFSLLYNIYVLENKETKKETKIMNEKQLEWTIKFSAEKAQFDACQSSIEVAQVTRKLRKAVDLGTSNISDGAINFFSENRRGELNQGIFQSGNGRNQAILQITNSDGRRTARKMS